MIVDVSQLSWLVRRLDHSATLKSFTVVVVFLTALLQVVVVFTGLVVLLVGDYDDLGTGMFILAVVVTVAFVAITPLGFLVWDWMARRPWKYLAAIVGGLLGGLLMGAIGLVLTLGVLALTQNEDFANPLSRVLILGGIVLVLVTLLLWMTTNRRGLAQVLGWTLVGLLPAVVVAVAAYFLDFEMGAELLMLLAVLVAVAFLFWVVIRAVRHRLILSGDVPRELVLGAIPRKRFWARLAFLTGLPSSLWNAAAMKTPPFWAFLMARPLVYSGALWLISGDYQSSALARTVIPGVLMIVVGHCLFVIAKRLAAWYLWSPEEPGDSERPILFLRNFQDDQLTFRRPWWRLDERWFDLWSFRRNVDEAMIDEIAQYGSVVALGVPGETMVPFGAQRYYAAHDDWKKIITDSAKRAEAIVVRASASTSVIWEYQMMADEGLLHKVLLLFPPPDKSEASSESLLETFAKATGLDLEIQYSSDKQLIALMPEQYGFAQLVAAKATVEAYVVALRAYFQRCPPEQLEVLFSNDSAVGFIAQA